MNDVTNWLLDEAADLIEQQQAEIERLQAVVDAAYGALQCCMDHGIEEGEDPRLADLAQAIVNLNTGEKGNE